MLVMNRLAHHAQHVAVKFRVFWQSVEHDVLQPTQTIALEEVEPLGVQQHASACVEDVAASARHLAPHGQWRQLHTPATTPIRT